MTALEHDCPVCGADAGQSCTATRGRTIGQPIKKFHPERASLSIKEAAKVKAHLLDDRPQKAWDAQVIREEKVQQVIWGIEFARKHLGTPQETIDRNLAEMLVDAELDLRLF